MADAVAHSRGRVPTWALGALIMAGLAIRVVLLPSAGFVGDIDQFVGWVGHIARDGLSQAYDTNVSFGPVMVFVWWILGIVDPSLVSAVDSSDPAVRVVMKLPAVAADLALAYFAWSGLRARPGWATIAVAVILLHPAIWFVSSWWGTYDSVYTAFAAAAYLLAVRGRDVLAVVALVLAVMTKPQAAPLVVPFAAWFLARAGWGVGGRHQIAAPLQRVIVLSVCGLGVLVVLWLPFIGANGPANYAYWLGRYQAEFYALLSISAWNPWWVMQELLAGGKYILDSAVLVGPITFRVAGYGLTALLLLCVGLFVARRPTPRILAVAIATAALIAFELLTTMHERYAFAVLPMLLFVLDQRPVRWVAMLFSTTFALNLISASDQYVGLVRFHGPITVVGSVLNVLCLVVLMLELARTSRGAEPPSVINDAAEASASGAGTRPDTSGDSGAATSAA
jgi:Gpi18-like mannosyltransferase